MSFELAPSVADDSSLPRFLVPRDVRVWGAEHAVAKRRPRRATLMLLETVVAYAAFACIGQVINRWWVWIVVWVGLVGCMMRIDAIHHEAVHRSLYNGRNLNDVIASIAGALEGFHGPTYRCFHLTHHALTRRDGEPSDPEAFYDELITRPHRLGPIRVPARVMYVVGILAGGIPFVLQLVAHSVATIRGRPPAYVRAASLERHIRRWGWLPFVVWAAAVAGAVGSGRGLELVRWWLVPMVLFLCGPYTFFAVPEHYRAERNGQMISSTGSVRSNALYRWIVLDGNFHLAHHVFPTASWWHLGAADDQLIDHGRLRYSGYLAFHAEVWRDLSTRRAAG